MSEFDDLVSHLLPVVCAASARVLAHYASDVCAQAKGDGSPVTQADEDAEAIILAGLAEIAPDIPSVSAEASAREAPPPVGARFFLVDLLDGTDEFINGCDAFAVNIALAEQGQPVFGLVDAPDWTLAGLALRPVRVHEADATGRFVICASRSNRNAKLAAYMARFPEGGILEVGSSLKFCMVAEGYADLYPRIAPTKELDTAAGHAMVTAAGGRVTREDGPH